MYIATGHKFVEEACRSAASVAACMPDIPISLFTDTAVQARRFDRVLGIDNATHSFEDKVKNLKRTPYHETLFLDSDTHMVEDSRELFSLLEKFDIAAVHSCCRTQYRVSGVPDSFPEFNTGVLVFRKSEQMDSLFDRWEQIYAEDQNRDIEWLVPGIDQWHLKSLPDQPAFRLALYESKLRFTTLPSEYNCRLPFPGYVHNKVKIVHGRTNSFTEVSKELNRTVLPRVHCMRWGKLRIFDSAIPAGESILERMRWSLHHHGILHTVRTTMKNLLRRS